MDRLILGLVLFFLLDSPLAYAAQSFYLPRQFSPGEIRTAGVALINPTTTPASATFRWRNPQGAVVATSQRAVFAKGQLAVILNQLFPDVSTPGWLSVDVDIDQVSAFWLGGDFVNSTDGAPLLNARSAIAEPAFAFIASTSEISLVNTESTAATGFMSLYNSAGALVTNALFEVPALGVFQQPVRTLFPAHAAEFDTGGYWIKINSSNAAARLVGTTVTGNVRDNVVTNAVVNGGSNQFLFPHIVAGPLGGAVYETQLSLANLQTAPQNVTLILKQASGPAITAQRTLPGSGALRTSITSLFNLSSVDGWLLVTTDGGNIAGFATYTDLENGGMAAVEMQPPPAETNLFFGHIADLNPWWTGAALINPSDAVAQVEVYAIDSTGNLIGGPAQSPAASFAIAGQSKKAFLLSDVIPATQTRTTDGGYILVRSTNGVGLYGTALFFLRSGRVYSIVPGTSSASRGFSPPITPATNAIQMSVAPAFVTVQTGGTQQFLAALAGTANTSVTWSVNDVAGGNAAVGRISQAGVYTAPTSIPDPNPVTIRATSAADAAKTASASVVVVPFATASTARFLTITSGPPPEATVNTRYLFNFTASGGRPPYTWAATTTIDSGMVLDSSTGILSGTPPFTGGIPLSVEVTDADGLKEAVQYELKFVGFGSSMFITNVPPTGTEGVSYFFKFTTSWTGGTCTPAVTLVGGSIPPGLILDGPNMTLSGTPLVAGSYTVALVATSGVNCSPAVPVRTNVQTFTVQVNRGSQWTRGASNWMRAGEFPGLTPTSGAWDGYAIRSVSVLVVYANDIYRLYYEGEDSQTHTRQIGLATSVDGRNWIKSPANPILRPGPPGSIDAAEIGSPNVIFDGSTYRMWYSGTDERNGCASMLLATSPDGIVWTKSPSNPLNLSNCNNTPGAVIRNAGTLMMWYSKLGGIGVATSTDGVRWTDRGTVIPNSADAIVAHPSVLPDTSLYRMWFNITGTGLTSAGGPQLHKTGIGFATSTDGITWTVSRDSDNNVNSIFVPGPTWDRPGIGQPSVIIDPNDSLLKMWYVGGLMNIPSSGTRAVVSGSIGLATHPP